MGKRVDRDVIVGVLAIAIAAVYWHFARAIAASLLSDAVGPQGLPKGYAIVLALLGMMLAVQGALRPSAAADGTAPAGRDELRSIGLLLFGIGYLVLIGPLGYVVTMTLLIVGVALYVGARPGTSLLAIAIGGALFLWATFAKLFELDLPTGSLWSRLVS
jgi:putative tricarboxylic transport membrane protein